MFHSTTLRRPPIKIKIITMKLIKESLFSGCIYFSCFLLYAQKKYTSQKQALWLLLLNLFRASLYPACARLCWLTASMTSPTRNTPLRSAGPPKQDRDRIEYYSNRRDNIWREFFQLEIVVHYYHLFNEKNAR